MPWVADALSMAIFSQTLCCHAGGCCLPSTWVLQAPHCLGRAASIPACRNSPEQPGELLAVAFWWWQCLGSGLGSPWGKAEPPGREDGGSPAVAGTARLARKSAGPTGRQLKGFLHIKEPSLPEGRRSCSRSLVRGMPGGCGEGTAQSAPAHHREKPCRRICAGARSPEAIRAKPSREGHGRGQG